MIGLSISIANTLLSSLISSVVNLVTNPSGSGSITPASGTITSGLANPVTGGSDATRFTANAGTGTCHAAFTGAFAAPNEAGPVTTTVFLDATAVPFIRMQVIGGAPAYAGEYIINAATGAEVHELVAASGGFQATFASPGILAISITDDVNGNSGNPSIYVGPHDGGASRDTTRVGGEQITLYKFQVEVGDTPTV